MNIITSFAQVKSVIGGFVKKDAQAVDAGHTPKTIIYFRYGARLVILLIVLYIFMWWPVDSFDPAGFDTWSERMQNLPDNVWYVVLAVILGWGTTEVMTSRAVSAMPTAALPKSEEDTGEDFMSGDFDGRFANLTDDDEELLLGSEPNPVLEEWSNNAPK